MELILLMKRALEPILILAEDFGEAFKFLFETSYNFWAKIFKWNDNNQDIILETNCNYGDAAEEVYKRMVQK